MAQTGICAVCGLQKKLTFEHFQPKAAGNNEKAIMKFGKHIFPIDEHLYGKQVVSHKGFGSYTLCKACNSLGGSNYVKAYVELYDVLQGLSKKKNDGQYYEITSSIYPLNVLKEVVMIFLSADRSLGTLRRMMADFVVDTESQKLTDEVTIYMFYALGTVYQAMGLSFGLTEFGPHSIAKFIYPPMGFLLTVGDAPLVDGLYDMSHFTAYRIDEKAEVKIRLKVIEETIDINFN